jgi:hypothetical protein
MGIERWYVMFYSDVTAPQSISTPPPESYRLLLQYEGSRFEIPRKESFIGTGQLVPRGKTPEDHRYTAVVMPLSLARNPSFMWVEMGPTDWEIYVRCNLVSSALLRTMLVSSVNRHSRKWNACFLKRERAIELAIAGLPRTAADANLQSRPVVGQRKSWQSLHVSFRLWELWRSPQQIVAVIRWSNDHSVLSLKMSMASRSCLHTTACRGMFPGQN